MEKSQTFCVILIGLLLASVCVGLPQREGVGEGDGRLMSGLFALEFPRRDLHSMPPELLRWSPSNGTNWESEGRLGYIMSGSVLTFVRPSTDGRFLFLQSYQNLTIFDMQNRVAIAHYSDVFVGVKEVSYFGFRVVHSEGRDQLWFIEAAHEGSYSAVFKIIDPFQNSVLYASFLANDDGPVHWCPTFSDWTIVDVAVASPSGPSSSHSAPPTYAPSSSSTFSSTTSSVPTSLPSSPFTASDATSYVPTTATTPTPVVGTPPTTTSTTTTTTSSSSSPSTPTETTPEIVGVVPHASSGKPSFVSFNVFAADGVAVEPIVSSDGKEIPSLPEVVFTVGSSVYAVVDVNPGGESPKWSVKRIDYETATYVDVELYGDYLKASYFDPVIVDEVNEVVYLLGVEEGSSGCCEVPTQWFQLSIVDDHAECWMTPSIRMNYEKNIYYPFAGNLINFHD